MPLHRLSTALVNSLVFLEVRVSEKGRGAPWAGKGARDARGMFPLHMRLQRAGLREKCSTVPAFERLLPRVGSPVVHQVEPGDESGAAVRTRVGADPDRRVLAQLVLLELRRLREGCTALITHVRLLPCVNSPVHVQLIDRFEGRGAIGAHKGLFSRVDKSVSFQVAASEKCSRAVGTLAGAHLA